MSTATNKQFTKAPRVAIIGGGITGLSAAYRLGELAAARESPLETTVFESSARVGGALETIRLHGCLLETGADSILSEKPWAIKLAERLSLQAEVIGTEERFRKTYVVRNGKLVAIPEGFSLMAPALFGPTFRSELFSPSGKLRMLMEPLIPRRRSRDDESLANFVTRRLGREVLERVAQPLAGGIYTGDPDRLSISATMPRFIELERRHGSVIRGLRSAAKNRKELVGTSGARWSMFISFKRGVSQLTDALAMRLGNSIRHNARVVGLERQEPSERPHRRAWRLRLEDDLSYEADAVISTIPSHALAPIIRPHSPTIAALLEQIDYASAATVNLAYRETDFANAPSGFGFVVPAIEKRKIIAGSFSSLKYQGRAPAGTILARVFIGGALQNDLMSLDDEEMVAAARKEFASLLRVTAAPTITHVRRWPSSMPQYAVGHLDRAAVIEREGEKIPNLAIAGAFLRGVGIPDCIHSGETAAEAIFPALTVIP